jgi:hypothetical protein
MQARLGFGRNPLRRPTDRFETLLILLAVLAGLLMVPAGAAVGTSVRLTSEDHAAQQRKVLHQVQARTSEAAPVAINDAAGPITARVSVSWSDTDGFVQEGHSEVNVGTKVNTEVMIWLDSSGRIAPSPRSTGDSAAIGGAAGLTIVTGSWVLLWLLVLAARRLLDRQRLRTWADEWKLVGPRWNQPWH